MSNKVLTTVGRVVMARALSEVPFLVAFSSGDPEWDAQWTQPNPPSPDIGATGIFNLIGYARPTIVDFLTADPAGSIETEEGGVYSLSEDPTRYLRIRMSLPPGAYPDSYIREIGIFAYPELADGVPAGKTVLAPEDVVATGELIHLEWFPAQFINAGTAYSHNLILKV